MTFLILGLVCLGMFTLYVEEGGDGPLHTVQLGASEVLRSARAGASYAAVPFEAAGNEVSGVLEGNDRAEKLREQAQKNQELAARAASLARENERLRKLVEGEQKSYEYAPLARVIAPVGGQFSERVRLNVGSKDGIEPYMPVVVGKRTLVGRTTSRITDHTSEVMLITDPSFAAGVSIVPPTGPGPPGETTKSQERTTQERTTQEQTSQEQTSQERTSQERATNEQTTRERNLGEGLLKMVLDGYLGVELVGLSADVEKGDFVITSGRMGGRKLIFPPGLLAGTVESVSAQDVDQYQKIAVDPAADTEDLREVRVIVDW